ncbi:MAG: hypothetical protein L0Y64_09215, partial [Myxococcaceae bacterium]|nr:hypothetical protein [Myxococcaceae bacterium]
LVMGLRPQPFLERLTPASQRFVARANVGLPEGAAPKAQEALVRVDALPLPPLAEGRPVLAQPAAPVSPTEPAPSPAPAVGAGLPGAVLSP